MAAWLFRGAFSILTGVLAGYLNENGTLNLARFEKYITKLAEHDVEQFRDNYADLKWLEGKLGGKPVNEAAARARRAKPRGFKLVSRVAQDPCLGTT